MFCGILHQTVNVEICFSFQSNFANVYILFT